MSGERGNNGRDAEVARGYTQLQRYLNYFGFVAWIVLVAYTGKHAIELMASGVSGAGWIAATAVLAALPVTDFISGLVHWSADNYGHEDWPVIGGFVKPFRNHHIDPDDMAHHGFWEMHGDHFVATLPFFWWATWIDGGGAGTLFWNVMWVGVAMFTIATAKFHAWAHTEEPPRVVRWLQRWRLILSPEHHDIHHTPPHAQAYCITNGWMNGPLRAVRFFEACEWLLYLLTSARPLTKQARADAATAASTSAKTSS